MEFPVLSNGLPFTNREGIQNWLGVFQSAVLGMLTNGMTDPEVIAKKAAQIADLGIAYAVNVNFTALRK